MEIDQVFYQATQGSPLGPMYRLKFDDDVADEHVHRDNDGNVTRGGLIGQRITSFILLTGLIYCWYAL